jgi:molybdate transport system permease protein
MIDFLSQADIEAFILTIKLAAITSLLLFLLSMPLAWWLSRMNHSFRVVLESVVALPLVLPPTVLGFYMLIAFAPDSWLGNLWQTLFNRQLAFSFDALVIGSMVYSLPFVVQPMQQAFMRLPNHLLEVYSSLGFTLYQRLRYLVWPLTKGSIMAAVTLGFAHTLGEFGVVLMIGGNIPGETQVISIALYDHVESLDYVRAHQISATLLVLSMIILIATYAKLGTPFKLMHTRHGS